MVQTGTMRVQWLGALAFIVVATTAVYASSLGGPFLFDDLPRIANDPRIRSAWPPWPVLDSSNRPFAHYTFAINYALHQDQVAGYHWTNLVIHICTAIALFEVVRLTWLCVYSDKSRQAMALATTVSLWWAVHPLNTQAVSYIVQRLESMMGLFYVLTLYGFVRARCCREGNGGREELPTRRVGQTFLDAARRATPVDAARRATLVDGARRTTVRASWYGFSVVCCAIGMGCKEVMVTAPVAVALFDWALTKRQALTSPQSTRYRWWYYPLLASTWGVLAWAMLHYQTDYRGGGLLSVKGLSPATYLMNQSAVISHYLRLAFWPVGQCAYYAWPVEHSLIKLMPYLAVTSTLVTLSIGLFFFRPLLGWLALSFFIALAPTSSIVPIVDLAFEHRMYLPLAFLITLLCASLGHWLGILGQAATASKMTLITTWACVVAVTMALGGTTYLRNQVYASELAFWQDITVKAPLNSNGWLGLGTAYGNAHNSQEAEACFKKALELAPDKARPQATYAGVLITRGKYTEANELLQKALQSEPNLPEVVIHQGLLLSLTGKFAEAQPYLEAGIQAAPGDQELQTNYIANLCYLQRFEQAYQAASDNLVRRPSSARAHNDVAACLLAKGDTANAQRYAQQAIELDPTLARAHATLGMAVSKRSTTEAIHHLERARQLEPQSYEFLSALATLKMESSPAEAIELYRQALTIRPQDVEMMLRIAMAYDATGQPAEALPFLRQALKLQPDLHPVRNYLRALEFRIGK